MRIAAPLLVAASLALLSSPSRADSPDAASEADARIAHGLALRRERHDAEALAEFRRAYALQPSARALAQVALAEDAVGLWVEAERTFEEVLARSGDPWVEKRRVQLGDELRELRTHLADLALDVVPGNAEVWINGALAKPDPATQACRVVSGRVLVEVKGDGFEPQRRVFEVPPGARVHDAIGLVATPPAAVAAEVPPRPSVPTSELLRGSLGAPQRREQAAVDVHRVLVFSSLAAAGSAFLIGTAGAVERQAAVAAYNDNSRCYFGTLPRTVRCAGAAGDVDRFTSVMAAGYATAGAFAIAGAILALTAPSRSLRIDVLNQGREGATLRVARDF